MHTRFPGALIESGASSGVFRWGRGGRAPYPRAKKKRGGGEKGVDLRPHTYVRTRGASTDPRISAAHTQSVSRGRTAPTTRIRGTYVHIRLRVHALFAR